MVERNVQSVMGLGPDILVANWGGARGAATEVMQDVRLKVSRELRKAAHF